MKYREVISQFYFYLAFPHLQITGLCYSLLATVLHFDLIFTWLFYMTPKSFSESIPCPTLCCYVYTDIHNHVLDHAQACACPYIHTKCAQYAVLNMVRALCIHIEAYPHCHYYTMLVVTF